MDGRLRSRCRAFATRVGPVGVAAGVIALGVVGVGAYAAIPDTPGGKIHVCYDRSDAERDPSGAELGIIDKARNARGCDSDDVELVFNQSGPAGPTGPSGPIGPAGPTGPAGSSGLDNLRHVDIDFTEEFGEPLPPGNINDAWTFDCGAGSKIVSGGAYIEEEANPESSFETKIDESGALDERRWRVRIRNVGDAPVHDHATFVCADPSGDSARQARPRGSGKRSAP